MAVRTVYVPWNRGYDLGVGADLASGSPMNLAVVGDATPVDRAEGSLVDFRVQRIRQTAELETALGIDADANYGCAAFGAGASARFSFAKNVKVQSSSLSMAVTALVELEYLSIDEPRLKDKAAEIINLPPEFEARYGNMFVRGLGRGGIFVGVLQMDTQSEEESTKIAGELQGTYGLFSADLSAKFQEVQNKYSSEISTTMFHEGGPVELQITNPGDPGQLLTNANQFLQSFHDNPDGVSRPYLVALAPLTIAEGPLPPNVVDVQNAQDVIVHCAKRRSALLDQLNLLEYIVDNSGRFDFEQGASLESVRQGVVGVEADLDLIASCASAAMNNVQAAALPAPFAQSRGVIYPQAAMPNPMPPPKDVAETVTVPDFRSCTTWAQCVELARASKLAIAYEYLGDHPEDFRVIDFRPPKDTQQPLGSVVTIVCPPDPPNLFRVLRTSGVWDDPLLWNPG